MRNVIEGIKNSSSAVKLALGAGLLLLILIPVGIHFYHTHLEANLTKQQEQLKQENQQLTDSYNQALGKAKANEQSAREEKAKADAIIATIEARTANVKTLDDKLEQVNKKYDQAKSELGDCGNPDDCLKRLCLELKAAGFKTPDCN